VLEEEVLDAFGPHRCDIVHAPGTDGPGPQQPAPVIADDGGLLGVLFLLARDECPTAWPARPGAADLDLGTAEAELDAFCLAIGDNIG